MSTTSLFAVPSSPSRPILQPLHPSPSHDLPLNSSPISLNKYSALTPPNSKRKLQLTNEAEKENIQLEQNIDNIMNKLNFTDSIKSIQKPIATKPATSSHSTGKPPLASLSNRARSSNSTSQSTKSKPAISTNHQSIAKPINVHNKKPEQTPAHRKSQLPVSKLALSAAVNPVTFPLPNTIPLSTPAVPLLNQPNPSPFGEPLIPSSSPFASSVPRHATPHWQIDYREVQRLHCPPLGTGAYGTVYRAEWHGVQVAVKQLDTDYLDPIAMKEFHQEMSVWSTLQFPSIVQLYGAFMYPHLSLVMHYCPHGSLSDHLHDPTLDISFDHLLRIAIQVAAGMNYLHSKNVLHRDLKVKPEQIKL